MYLVVDLEATCCDQDSIPQGENEIIEIGAVMVDADTLEPVDEFMTFVKSVHHPTLSSYCTELTSITQKEVDGAPENPAAMKAFTE